MRKWKIFIAISLCFFLSVKSISANRVASEHKNSDNISFHSKDTIDDNLDEKGYAKGQVLLHLSFPYINSFHVTPPNKHSITNTGLIGYSIGLDYCYQANQYVSISFSEISDLSSPIYFTPVLDEYEIIGSDYLISLTNNHHIRKLSLGYGFFFAQEYWEIVNHNYTIDGSGREPIKEVYNVIGLVFTSYFRPIDVFRVGIIYRPSFYRFNINPAIKYEHSISIDFAWKIPLRKKLTAANKMKI